MDSKLFFDLFNECNEYLLDLHTAASIGCEERVRDIIENTEDKSVINLQNKNGWTPLMYASCCTNLKIVLLLLEEEAITDLKNYRGHTALILASKCGSTDAVSLLLDYGASINDQDLRGWSALFYASSFGHRSVVHLLIEKGALVNIRDQKEGLTPLMLSAAAGHEMIVQDLLQFGLDPLIESRSGETARSLAIKNGHMNVENIINAHICTKKICSLPSVRSPDLQSLFKAHQLSKYYYLFENHGIDLNTFWLLTEEDLKEIGIQLVGPRKKMCVAIEQWCQSQAMSGGGDDRTFTKRLLLENQRYQQQLKELKSMLSQEMNLRKAAEKNLNQGIETLKNFTDAVQRTIGYSAVLQEKLRQNLVNLRKLLSYNVQGFLSMDNWTKFKVDTVFPLMDIMNKLVDDIRLQTTLSLQQTNFKG